MADPKRLRSRNEARDTISITLPRNLFTAFAEIQGTGLGLGKLLALLGVQALVELRIGSEGQSYGLSFGRLQPGIQVWIGCSGG
ncbi:MAG: hypothetical protein AAGI12_10160 [Pseudomonadota bacterium]